MRPSKGESGGSGDLFRSRLDQIINMRHELVRLASEIDWDWIDAELADLFADAGRPAVPTRFMVGLFFLKHIYGLSDDGVCERWVHDPYFQHFTGETFFQHDIPHERSGMSHWRKRIGGRLDKLLAETLRVAHATGALKGKAHKPYEFGVKVSLTTTNKRCKGGQFILHAKALPGRPYDGHTLREVIEETQNLTGREIERVYVDKGYVGHDAPKPLRVYRSGQKRGVRGQIKRELRRRSAIEAVIGHCKTDGHLDRNFLKGRLGDHANAVLTAVGYNFRLILKWLKVLLRQIFDAVIRDFWQMTTLKSAS